MSMEFKVFSAEEAREVDPESVPWPDGSVVLYAVETNPEGASRIVGRSSLMPLYVVEGSWVAEDKRGSTLINELVKRLEAIVVAEGKSTLLALSHDKQPRIKKWLKRHGWSRFPVTLHQKEVDKDAINKCL